MKQKLLASAMALAMVLSLTPVTALAAEDEATPETVPAVEETTAEEVTTQETVTVTAETTNYTIDTPTKLVVSSDITLTGSGDAFEINADTTLVFEDDASLTLSGYTNGFVVSNATLSGGGWVINDGDGMHLFKLNTDGKLNITGNVDLNGKDKTEATASRAIFLPWGTSGQAVTLGENVTLAATNFYRGLETGGASNYTISGAGMNSSEFDFSDNNCGMALNYFDQNAHFKNCTLEVSNCTVSGIFMRQDNASLNGLYIDNVFINCVNDELETQENIAIRFHTVQFKISNSVINIEHAWNTGLWICDGWDEGQTKEISNTTINVKHVEDVDVNPTYGALESRKAITLVPYGDWTIDNCEITMEGIEGTPLECGLNIASDVHVNRNGFTFTAKASMFGGTVKLQNTEIYTSYIQGADVGAQIAQFIEIGPNVVIDNGYNDADSWIEHYTVICNDVSDSFQGQLLGIPISIDYDVSNLTDAQKSPDRIKVVGGSYYSTRAQDLEYGTVEDLDLYETSVPVNAAGEDLTMFKVSADSYDTYSSDGVITLVDKNGTEYAYEAAATSKNDPNFHYIWAPTATVTLVDASGSSKEVPVPRGVAFGLTQTLDAGSWITSTGEAFTEESVVTGNMIITAQ